MIRIPRSAQNLRLLCALAVLCTVTLSSATPAQAASRPCRPGLKPVVLKSESVAFAVSPCGGGVESIRLLDKQFDMDEDRTPAVVPKWAKDKWKPGPLELVGTWDAKWDPFRDRLSDVKIGGSAKVTLAVAEPDSATPTSVTVDDLGAWGDKDPRWGVADKSDTHVTLVWPDPERVKSPLYVVKRYAVAKDSPRTLNLQITVWNLGGQAAKFRLRHVVSTWSDPNAEGGGLFAAMAGPPDLKSAAFHIGDETNHLDVNALADADPDERFVSGTPSWLAVDSRYFMLATLPGKGWGKGAAVGLQALTNGVVESTLTSAGEALPAADKSCVPAWYAKRWGGVVCDVDFKKLGLQQGIGDAVDGAFLDKARIAAGGADKAAVEAAIARVRARQVKGFAATLYAGPKQIDYLREVGSNLDDAIDFGWFGVIGRPLLMILRWAHGATGSWPLAIILLTVLVKALLWPIMGKSMKSMRKMQTLKPELDRIKARLEKEAKAQGLDRPDPQKLNQETFALYRRHGVNPLGGCLPMFLQMPVYIALYRTIYSSVELYNQPLFGWITDLTQKDPFYVLPIVLGAVMFAQQKIMPNPSGDPAQQKVLMYFMPAMFTLLMLSLPSGLTLYILVNSVLSIVQNLWLRRDDPKPA